MADSGMVPAGYPYPETKSIRKPMTEEEYNLARLEWRINLSDFDVRSMASDYRLGNKSEDNYDAYLEYLDRFSQADTNARQRKSASKKPRRKARV